MKNIFRTIIIFLISFFTFFFPFIVQATPIKDVSVNQNVQLNIDILKTKNDTLQKISHIDVSVPNNMNKKIWLGDINDKDQVGKEIEILPLLDVNTNSIILVTHLNNFGNVSMQNITSEVHCQDGETIYVGFKKDDDVGLILKITPIKE